MQNRAVPRGRAVSTSKANEQSKGNVLSKAGFPNRAGSQTKLNSQGLSTTLHTRTRANSLTGRISPTKSGSKNTLFVQGKPKATSYGSNAVARSKNSVNKKKISEPGQETLNLR